MDVGAVKYTKLELIRSVIMQKVPGGWLSGLLRARNNNVISIEVLIVNLVPIEIADSEDQKRKNNRSDKKGDRKLRWNCNSQDNNDRGNRPWRNKNYRGRSCDSNQR